MMFFRYLSSLLPLLLLLMAVSHAEDEMIFENSCHVVNPDIPGCDNSECREFVCGNIPACCEEGWTNQCVSLALVDVARCPYTDEYDNFNCFQYPQPAGCFDPPGCRASVCLVDQTCCDIIHNEDCALLAVERCASDLPKGNGNTCYETSEEPGCHDTVSCVPAVCSENPNCCGVAYDEECIDIARQNPTECLPPASNNTCVETSVVGGCKEADCELKVCDIDPTCCRTVDSVGEFTQDCVDIATSTCPGVDDPPTNDCFTVSSRPGCNNSSCVHIVCATNPECCTDEYKPACVQIARQNGILCGVPEPTNDCNEISEFGGCENAVCEAKVCAIKPECCNQGLQVGEWSTQCTQLAVTECNGNELNSCFENVRTPGCSNQRCQRTVCREDDFCCERQWDSNCVEKAMENLNVCNTGFPPQENNCFEVDPFERSGCDNSEYGIESTNSSTCFNIVCENREECCDGPYDQDCVNTALDNCPLPEPRNHCFEVGAEVPGCSDTACAERVCLEEPNCCTRAPWNEAICIDEARNHPDVCKPPKSTNHCGQESLYGGCEDDRCEAIVCGAEPGCCNSEEETGQYNDFCVSIANDLCQPTVLPRPEGDCPPGFTCDSDSMANCSGIRETMKDAMDFGDLYGGIYCGNPTDDIENCEIGHYCPNPETKIICPAGFFCPHKSLVPDLIKCAWCKEGSVKLVVDLYGYIVLGVVVAFVIFYALFKLAKLYNMAAIDRLQSFQSSFLSHQFGEFEHRMQELKNKVSTRKKPKGEGEDLEKLRPKLELINRRIKELKAEQEAEAAKLDADGQEGENGEAGSSARGGDSKIGSALGKLKSKVSTAVNVSTSSIEDKRAPIEFDARAVFDVLDADDSGDVSFEELNRILGFNELELGEFVRRMNELGGQSKDLESVTRPVFVKYFLQVLKDTTNLTVSFEEAEELFLEMSMGKNEVHMSKFYTSSMSDFLSDIQILDLIKRFKAIKKGNMAYQSGRPSGNKSGRSGSGRRATILQRNQSIAARRQSLFSVSGAGGGGSVASGTVVGVTKQSLMLVSKADFTEHYPQLLLEVTVEDADIFDDEEEGKEESLGVDISFQNLSLSVDVGGSAFNVVDGVTGRIRGKTMTALMGGSGAGKTSLLNALCGRAFYGETTGTIHVNGQETTIEDHKDMVGFVPQDDIVYAELTVRENLIYAGRFRLPKGTPDYFIEDLADETLANLGLSRVANSPVGDVRRRGVSGGEKKRVNIGLELMAEPAILFLDEPTSGLDASSALLVMKSLKHLVDKQGVTIVSVIHQPRKFIYDLFDSLILLGVGGRMVYHGPTGGTTEYFENLSYSLPPGESVADWLIDISSGRLEPDNRIAGNRKLERLPKQSAAFRDLGSLSQVMEGEESKPFDKPKSTKELNDEVKTPPKNEASKKGDKKSTENRESQRIAVTDSDIVGGKGVTAGKVVAAFEEAKHRRAWLYDQWIIYFENLNRAEKSVYTKPEAYDLPVPFTKPSFGYQFWHQLARQHIVAWRNRVSKLTDCVIIVAAVAIIAGLDGVTEPTVDNDPEIPFEILVRPILSEDAPTILQQTFKYAYTRQITYALKVGIILSVLLGLTGTKIIVSKRLEFFREAASGYNINAYFFSVNAITLVENAVQVLFASFFCAWFRRPLAGFWSFLVHFELLAILCLSWSILISLVLPPDQVTLAAGFFFSFCGLLISGAFPPILYKDIYEEGGFKELLAGWLSPTRYFYESLAVGEYRCMPEQSAFTITDEAVNRPYNTSMIIQLGYAGHDPTATRYACNGWYWGVLPVLFVSLTVRYGACLAMHGFNRSQQTKKSLMHEMKKDHMVAVRVAGFILILCGLFGISTWAMKREVPFSQPELTREDRIADYLAGGGLG